MKGLGCSKTYFNIGEILCKISYRLVNRKIGDFLNPEQLPEIKKDERREWQEKEAKPVHLPCEKLLEIENLIPNEELFSIIFYCGAEIFLKAGDWCVYGGVKS